MIIELPKKEAYIEIEVQPAEEAFDEFNKDINEALKAEGIDLKLPENLDELSETENFGQCWVAYEESWKGDNPERATLTGWWDIYEGELTEEEEEKISKIVKNSKTLRDVLIELHKEFEGADVVYDEYYEDFRYFLKKLIKELKEGKE